MTENVKQFLVELADLMTRRGITIHAVYGVDDPYCVCSANLAFTDDTEPEPPLDKLEVSYALDVWEEGWSADAYEYDKNMEPHARIKAADFLKHIEEVEAEAKRKSEAGK